MCINQSTGNNSSAIPKIRIEMSGDIHNGLENWNTHTRTHSGLRQRYMLTGWFRLWPTYVFPRAHTFKDRHNRNNSFYCHVVVWLTVYCNSETLDLMMVIARDLKYCIQETSFSLYWEEGNPTSVAEYEDPDIVRRSSMLGETSKVVSVLMAPVFPPPHRIGRNRDVTVLQKIKNLPWVVEHPH